MTNTEPPPRQGGSLWEDPAIRAIALYALLAIAGLIAAYYAIFTTFVEYDDEGTVLVSLNAFAHGNALYADVFSPYGPFFFELFGGLSALFGHDFTTDVSRSVVIVLWVTASLLFGLACQKLTGRLLLGAVGMVVAFSVLYALYPEPMHPHGLLVVLLGGFVLAAVHGPGRRTALLGAVAGVLLGAALMTKVNFGAYAIAGAVLAAALTVEPLSRRAWLRWLVAAAYIAMPLAILSSELSEEWARSFIALQTLGSGAIVVAAWPLQPARGERQEDLWRWLLAAAAGCVAAVLAVLLTLVALGTSPAELYDGMVGSALNVRNVAGSAFQTPNQAIYWAVISFAAAVLTGRLRALGGGSREPKLWPGLARAAAAIAIWLTIARASPFGLNPSANPDVLTPLLAWIALVPPGPEQPYMRFLRVLLPAVAVAGVLGVYPVPGAQIGIASLMFVPVGALLIADALVSLRAWSAARGEDALRRFGASVGVGGAALLGMLGLGLVVLPTIGTAIVYDERPALPFEGAGDVHVEQEQVDEYVGVVEFLRRNRCTQLIGMPNVDSLYLWTGIEAPKPYPPGAWPYALDDAEQDRILTQLRETPRPCTIRNDKLAPFLLDGRAPPDTPLVHYMEDEFEQVGRSGETKLYLPKEATKGS